jgi:hypothetical protein
MKHAEELPAFRGDFMGAASEYRKACTFLLISRLVSAKLLEIHAELGSTTLIVIEARVERKLVLPASNMPDAAPRAGYSAQRKRAGDFSPAL